MFRSFNIFFVLALFFSTLSFSQTKETEKKKDTIVATKKKKKKEYNALSPSKAAFFSAVFPGGGQIYNKRYWKAPIIWAGMGTSIYFYLDNNREYKRYRRAFKQRKNGLQDEFTLDDGTQVLSDEGLERAQKVLRNNREITILTTIGIYVLQIVEASVNAHLLQFDDGDSLSVSPSLTSDPFKLDMPALGFKLKYSF